MKYRTRVREFEVIDLAGADDQMSPGAFQLTSINGQQFRIFPDDVIVTDGGHTSVVPRQWFEMFCEPVEEPEPEEAVAVEDVAAEEDKPLPVRRRRAAVVAKEPEEKPEPEVEEKEPDKFSFLTEDDDKPAVPPFQTR